MAKPAPTSSVRGRIRLLLESQGFRSVNAAARALGLATSTLQAVMARDRISRKTAEKIADVWGLEPDWVERGWGPMQKRGSEIKGNMSFQGSEGTETVTEPASSDAQPLLASLVIVPKAAAKLSAGRVKIAEETKLPERYAFRRDWLRRVASSPNNVIMMEVDGDGMVPTLNDGDTVLIDLGRTEIGQGGIFAVAVGDVILIKRLELLPHGKIHVLSDNDAYGNYTADPKDIRIIGERIWYGRTCV